jgi:hypothetical protein
MTWPKSWVGSYLTLVPSSTRMPRRTHRGWPEHYPIIHLWSEVRYRPAHRHTKLLSLRISYVPYASVQFKCLFIRAQPMRTLINTGGGHHLGAPNIRSDNSPFFPSSILHFLLIAPLGLILSHSTNYSSFQHSFHEPGYQKALNLISGSVTWLLPEFPLSIALLTDFPPR